MINVNEILDKKILLIDDEENILDILEIVLLKEGFKSIYKASNGLDGIKMCSENNPDIVVLDIMLPDADGFEVCKRIREFSFVPIIFLSAKTDDIDKLLGLGIGGDDYVTKPFSPKEVAFRVKAHLRRNQYLDSKRKREEIDKITFGDIEIDINKSEVLKSKQIVNLTAKEYQILIYMAKNENQILSKKKICDYIWEDEFIGYENSIMVHIRHLREKIEEDPSNPKYLKTIKGLGYKLSTRGN